MPRLRRADCAGPGITRRRHGKGFEYIDASGVRIGDPVVLQRVRDLAIPPAWTDVWICPHPMGHIQALGTDAAGRKQYLYHQRWRERRDRVKFDEMCTFARVLPAVREVTGEHLAAPGMGYERVLACAVRLLDRGFFRIGSEDYAEQNQTYGLATMRKEHVTVRPREVVFDYIAKGSKQRIQSIVDPQVRDVVAALKRRRSGGDELLAFRRGRTWYDVRSADINAYLKDISGGDYSAKDFRTWHGTVLAAVTLAVAAGAQSRSARKRAIALATREVAHYLGNTPAVCRKSYIDPRVFDRFVTGVTIQGALADLGAIDALGEPATQGVVEEAVLDLLEDNRASPAVVKGPLSA